MLRVSLVRWAAAAALCYPGAAAAGEIVLDYERTLALAAERAPEVAAARAQVGEAEAGRAGAAVRFVENPELEIEAGPRFTGAGETLPELSIGLWQGFELGGRRAARLDVADAEVIAATAAADEVLRLALREAALAYYRVLWAEARLQLARDAEGAAAQLLAVTERRLAKGDAVALEVNLAKSAHARARAAVHTAEADREAELGALRALLGLGAGETVRVTGSLAARAEKGYQLDALLAAARKRPELRELEAEREQGEALVRLGQGERWPELRLGVVYAHEEEADLLLGTLSFTLPVWQRGQQQQQLGRAQAARAGGEAEGRWRAIEAAVRAAFAVYGRRLAAVDEYERQVLPLLDENEALAKKSYEAGAMPLAEVLIARRELFDARREYLALLFELAASAVELEAAAGVLR